MIQKLNDYLERKVLGGLNLKREHVPLEMTQRDWERFSIMIKAISTSITPLHSVDKDVKVLNYSGVVLKIKIGKKTSDFLK